MDAIHRSDAAIWMDGTFVPFQEARIHPLSNTVQYGMGVFEGIRCYPTEGGASIFRLSDHTKRLFESAHIMDIQIPFTQTIINEGICETARRNQISHGYLRPAVYLGWETVGLHAQNLSVHVMIAGWTMGEYLQTANPDAALRVKTSAIARNPARSSFSKTKVCGQYIYSTMAYKQVRSSGCDDAIMLDESGCIAEATTSNIFIIKDGVVHTPTEVSILVGITRDTVLNICQDMQLPVVVRNLTREDAYTADEMFLVGTAAEVKPIGEYDDRKIGSGMRGPITKRIQTEFKNIVFGKNKKYANWLAPL